LIDLGRLVGFETNEATYQAKLAGYFGSTGIVISVPSDFARRPMTLMPPPCGTANSTKPRLPAAA